MIDPFIQFGMIILVVLGVSVIMKILKQPLIIGYILSGILSGPFFLNLIAENDTINVFSEMGISFLLFIVGLHLSPKVIKEVGAVSLTTGLGQIIFTSLIGYFLGNLLGFPPLTSIYVAIALTFSSTIIIMKLLSDKDALEKLYGKISIGFLLVQDLIAIMIMVVISSLSSGSGDKLYGTILGGLFLLAILIPISSFVLPKLSDFFANSQEFLFIFAISWGFGLSLIFLYIGLSIEVGALIAGIMLSLSPYSREISLKLKPLRDFFIISFFIILGSRLAFGDITHLIVPAVIFSLFILIGNPIIVMALMGLLKYSKKTGFMAGLTVAQISEFSLILIALGVKTGSLPNEILSFVTIIGLITIAGSTYLIIYSDFIFNKISWLLAIFERRKIKEKNVLYKKYDCILLGYNRIGYSIIKVFSKMTKNFLVVDYDPKIVKQLQQRGINVAYGDVDELEFLESLRIDKAAIIVSTIPDKETNQLLLNFLRRSKSKAIAVLTGRQISDAFDLYNLGAHYVILPHFLGGEYASKLIEAAKNNKNKYAQVKKKELKNLEERLRHGHEHPRIEKNLKYSTRGA